MPTPEEDIKNQLVAHHETLVAFTEVNQIDHLVKDHKIPLWELKDRDAVQRARIHRREHGLYVTIAEHLQEMQGIELLNHLVNDHWNTPETPFPGGEVLRPSREHRWLHTGDE